MGIKLLVFGILTFLSSTLIGLAGLHRDPLPGEAQQESQSPIPVPVPPTAGAPVQSPSIKETPAEVPAHDPMAANHQATIDDNTLTLLTADATTLVATENADATGAEPIAVKHHNPIGTFVAGGISDGTVKAITIGADYHFETQWAIGERGWINPFSEFLLGYWEGKEGHTGITSLHEIGASLLLRYRYLNHDNSTIRPFVDVGMGIHYLTETRIEGKELGRNWQAGSNLGIGLLFGSEERFEAGIRIRHLSNAGTDADNWGVNQILARLAIRL